VTLGIVAALVLATALVPSTATAAPSATLRIDPASVSVTTGSTFEVKVVQAPPVATSGAQASINFDPKILQVVSVAPGPGYAGAPIFLPKDLNTDIRNANLTGHLAQIAAAWTPPGAVPAGAATFLIVTFHASGCGQTDVTLPTGGPFDAQMISGEQNGYGEPVAPVLTSNGHVTTCVPADAVTPGITLVSGGAAAGTTGSTSTGPTGSALPLPLIAAAALIVIGLLAGFAWQSRRRSPSRVAE
jgi:hypothetical protein